MTRRNSLGMRSCLGLLVAASWAAAAAAQTTAPDLPTRSQGRGSNPSAPIVPGTTPNLNRGGQAGMAGQFEEQKVVSHALSMAIEGYTLRCAAKEAGGSGGAADRKDDPAGMLRQHARAAFEASDRLFQQASQSGAGRGGRSGGQGGAGAGTGAAGRNPGAGGATATGTGGASSAGTGAAGAVGASGTTSAPGEPITTGRAGAGAGAGGEAALAGSAFARFLTASNEYASTLRRLSPEADDAAGNDGKKDEASRSRTEPSREDKARIAALNHAVKEVIEGRMIRHGVMMNTMSDRSSGAARALMQHAQEMTDEGRRALATLASANDAGGAQGNDRQGDAKDNGRAGDERKGGDRDQMRAASVRTLALHAQEIARAVSDLSQGDAAAGGAGGAARSGRDNGEGGGDATGRNAGAGGTGTGSRTIDRGNGTGTGTGGAGTGTGSPRPGSGTGTPGGPTSPR